MRKNKNSENQSENLPNVREEATKSPDGSQL